MRTPFFFRRKAAALCAPALCALALCGPQAPAADQAPGPSGYTLAATWKLGGEGRWDYMTIDSDAGRLYIARENRIQVVNTTTGALLGEVPGIDGAHGVAIVAGVHRGYATSGRDGKVIAFDLTTLRPFGDPIRAGSKPDAIAFDLKSNRLFAMNGQSDNITVIDPVTSTVTGTIPLPGAPEFAVTDNAGELYVNIEDKSETAAIDTLTLAVTSVWPLAPGVGPTGLSIDGAGRRLFAGCAGNRKLIVLDDMTGKVLAALPIGAHVDATRFDPGTGYAFSSNGDGTLTVAAADGAGEFKVIDTVRTKAGARTMALDPKTHAVYVCSADFGPPDPNAHGRPKPLPGTFVVMKFTKKT